MGYRKGYYRKDGTYVQGHYANNRSKSFSNKNNNGCVILILLFTAFSSILSCSESSDSSEKNSTLGCPTKTCGDFTSQTQAQATFNNNKSCYKNLDADGDGIACENLSK
jgi:hypothetical protein